MARPASSSLNSERRGGRSGVAGPRWRPKRAQGCRDGGLEPGSTVTPTPGARASRPQPGAEDMAEPSFRFSPSCSASCRAIRASRSRRRRARCSSASRFPRGCRRGRRWRPHSPRQALLPVLGACHLGFQRGELGVGEPAAFLAGPEIHGACRARPGQTPPGPRRARLAGQPCESFPPVRGGAQRAVSRLSSAAAAASAGTGGSCGVQRTAQVQDPVFQHGLFGRGPVQPAAPVAPGPGRAPARDPLQPSRRQRSWARDARDAAAPDRRTVGTSCPARRSVAGSPRPRAARGRPGAGGPLRAPVRRRRGAP